MVRWWTGCMEVTPSHKGWEVLKCSEILKATGTQSTVMKTETKIDEVDSEKMRKEMRLGFSHSVI